MHSIKEINKLLIKEEERILSKTKLLKTQISQLMIMALATYLSILYLLTGGYRDLNAIIFSIIAVLMIIYIVYYPRNYRIIRYLRILLTLILIFIVHTFFSWANIYTPTNLLYGEMYDIDGFLTFIWIMVDFYPLYFFLITTVLILNQPPQILAKNKTKKEKTKSKTK